MMELFSILMVVMLYGSIHVQKFIKLYMNLKNRFLKCINLEYKMEINT